MNSVRILGARVDRVDLAQAIRAIVTRAQGDVPSLVVTLGTEMVMRAQSDRAFAATLDEAWLCVCDTVGVQAAARLVGMPLPRVNGIDLLCGVAQAGADEGLRIYFLGAKGDTAANAARELVRRYPGLQVAGARDGFFPASEEGAVAAEIARCEADIVFVALGSPRQERFIAQHLRATGARVGIGVGGSFDVLAGNVARAPAAWRRLNLEWLYRLVREPARWRRQLALPRFAALVLLERFGSVQVKS